MRQQILKKNVENKDCQSRTCKTRAILKHLMRFIYASDDTVKIDISWYDTRYNIKNWQTLNFQ